MTDCSDCHGRGWVASGDYKVRCACPTGDVWAETMEGELAAVGDQLRTLFRQIADATVGPLLRWIVRRRNA